METHSVTCHLTQVSAPRLNHSHGRLLVLKFTYLGMEG